MNSCQISSSRAQGVEPQYAVNNVRTTTAVAAALQTAFGFTGELADANGLLTLRARHYAPAGRRVPLARPGRSIPTELRQTSRLNGRALPIMIHVVSSSAAISKPSRAYSRCAGLAFCTLRLT